MRLEVLAPAKINVGLRILGRRPDGFHDLETLFLAVGLFDRVELELLPGDRIELEVSGADVGPAEDNLAVRAVHAFREATGRTLGCRIRLEKRIPAGAGLGGGSSDAGAVLRLLDQATGAGLGAVRLGEIGATLGADVAFFARGEPFAIGRGRGDDLTPLPAPPSIPVVLGLPPVHVATGPAYQALAAERAERGGVAPGPLLEGTPVPVWRTLLPLLVNDFEPGVRRAFPQVDRALSALEDSGAEHLLLSGSGGAVFALLPPGDDEPQEASGAPAGGGALRSTALHPTGPAARLAEAAAALAPEVSFVAVRTLSDAPPVREG